MGILDMLKGNKPKRNKEYLIEIRFSGFVKESIRELKEGIAKNFRVSEKKIIPHVTLVGPLYTSDEKKLVKQVVSTAKKHKRISLKLDGFGHFENNVIFVKIKPSDELEKFRSDLVDKLKEFCYLSEFDEKSEFTYHATIVLHDIYAKFDRIWEYVQTWKIPEIEQYVVRITLLNEKRKILCEYDLMLGKLLNRSQALDRGMFRKTVEKLRKIKTPSEIQFEDVTDKERVYLFSDAHFDHGNIIRYCRRPFDSARQMNHSLLYNWNNTVKEDDVVYFLGDMTFGRHRRPIDFWLGKLNGKIFYIRGNHDSDAITRATVIPTRHGIQYGKYEFLLSHDPYRPFGYKGWIIHGDKHNNSMGRYPFINPESKTVNVCAEMVNYTPLALDELVSMLETGRRYRTINDKPL